MSRCFPYPPPGFGKKHVPLIESSIKLHKEKDRTEKKRKKKEKKEKCIDGTATTDNKNHAHKKRHREERNKMKPENVFHSKAKEEETEQLERSSLTEEHGLSSVPDLCDSPDSSQNRNKKIKHGAVDSIIGIQGGSKLRIRIPSLKKREIEQPSLAKQSSLPFLNGRDIEQPASAERLNLSLSRQKPSEKNAAAKLSCLPLHDQRHAEQNAVLEQPHFPLLKQKEEVTTTPIDEPYFSGRTETALPCEKTSDVHKDHLFEAYNGSSKSRRKEAKFKDLIVNWQPQPLQVDQELDENWLFSSQRQQDVSMKRAHIESGGVHFEHASDLCLWPPRACHVLGTDICALPFVLPF